MTDRETYDGDWIADWIALQRKTLTQPSHARSREGDAADVGKQWAEAGQAFFEGLRQFASGGAGASIGAGMDPFNVGDALLGAWSGATFLQSTIAEQAAELLKRLPPIGLAREQTEAWRELVGAHAECKRLEHDLRAVLAKVQMDALGLLEQRVRERQGQKRIDTFRELYDLWVQCGEQVYSKLAHSEAYSKLQAELGNATMRLRTRVQTVVEHSLKQLDLPTRSELNSVHRQLRELRLEVERLQAQSPAKRATKAKARKR